MTTVQEYYDQCYSDYKLVWRTDRNLGIHYGFYDNGQKNHDKAVVRMNEVLATKAEVTSADRVLDAGCGIGGSSIWLAKNIGCSVTGININDGQLRISESLVRENGLDGLIRLYNMDFSHTELPGNCFDVVWALESSCYAIDKLDFLREAKRLLKRNGRLVVADGFLVDCLSEPGKQAVWSWARGWAAPNLTTLSEFKRYLGEIGFIKISFNDITANVMPSSRRMYLAAVTLFPLGKLLELFRVRTKVQTANIESAINQHRTLVGGLWKYGIFTARKGGFKNEQATGAAEPVA